MKYQDQQPTQREPKTWIIDSIQALLKREIKEIEETKEESTEEEEGEPTKEGNRLISLEITPEDYEEGFRKWSEMTATSPSGRHLGLYKALLGIENLSEFFAGMCELPVLYGFAPQRWAHVLKLMLEKDKGIP